MALPVGWRQVLPRCQKCKKKLNPAGTAKELNGRYWHNQCYFEAFPEHKKYFGRGGRERGDTYQIECDHCHTKTLKPCESLKRARKDAGKLGWWNKDQQDLCPSCRPGAPA